MTHQVLIMNVTRMGDLIQTGPLLARLRHEWPDVQVDVLVDRQFAAMARLLSDVRTVHAYDFNEMINVCRAMSRDVVALYRDMKRWASALREQRYDRVVNLTFTRRTGLLASYIGAPDMRGVISGPDGSPTIRDPWLSYFTDLHRYRRFNRFNLVDLYALGGSGLGPHAPLSLTVEPDAAAWAQARLASAQPAEGWVAVQVGASEAIKAWRPAYFGQAMAALGRRLAVGFVMLGTESERAAVHEALAAYRQAGGTAPVLDVVNRTTIPQAIALLSKVRLLLTNDTGPMHMAVAVGTRVVDLSVGHVDFHETGPYGRGHWVVQPDLHCAPCGFDRICLHHACKDRVGVEQVAALCAHALDRGPLPGDLSGIKVYESTVDADGLVAYQQRGGSVVAVDDWYGQWWKQFWLGEFAGRPVPTCAELGPAPDAAEQAVVLARLDALIPNLLARVQELERVTSRTPLHGPAVVQANQRLQTVHRQLTEVAEASPAFGPLVVALQRELVTDEGLAVEEMARGRCRAFRRCSDRICRVGLAFGLSTGAVRGSLPNRVAASRAATA